MLQRMPVDRVRGPALALELRRGWPASRLRSSATSGLPGSPSTKLNNRNLPPCLPAHLGSSPSSHTPPTFWYLSHHTHQVAGPTPYPESQFGWPIPGAMPRAVSWTTLPGTAHHFSGCKPLAPSSRNSLELVQRFGRTVCHILFHAVPDFRSVWQIWSGFPPV